MLSEISNAPNYVRGMSMLRDLSSATLSQSITKEKIQAGTRENATIVSNVLGDRRNIAWVVSNARDFKLIHQLCVFTRLNHNNVERQPFRKIGNALEWLGIPKDYEIKYPD
jgi:hypothetical protein